MNKRDLAIDIPKTVHRLQPRNLKSPIVVSAENENRLVAFIETMHKHLNNMLEYYEEYMDRLKNAFGPKVTQLGTIEELWARYAARDTDSARLLLGEIGRYTVDRLGEGMGSKIVEPLRKRVDIWGAVVKSPRWNSQGELSCLFNAQRLSSINIM